MVLGDVVAGGVQQYSWRSGKGRSVWVRYVRTVEVDERGALRRAALAAMYVAARLLHLRCADGHAVARVLPSGALGVRYVHA